MATYSSFGTQFQIDDGAGNFTTVAQVLDIDGPAESVDLEETTNQQSPGGYEEHIPTIKRSGELTFDVLYDPSHATHAATGSGLKALLVARVKRNMRVVYPTTPAIRDAFAGFVTGLGKAAPVTGTLRAAVTVKPIGPITTEAAV